jgi:arginase family enzyme
MKPSRKKIVRKKIRSKLGKRKISKRSKRKLVSKKKRGGSESTDPPRELIYFPIYLGQNKTGDKTYEMIYNKIKKGSLLEVDNDHNKLILDYIRKKKNFENITKDQLNELESACNAGNFLNTINQIIPEHGLNYEKKLKINKFLCTEKKDNPELRELIDKHVFQELQNLYNRLDQNKNKKVIIGGDHSIAIPSIAHSLNNLKDHEDLRVIYFDAHADINSDKESKSKNIHGMPLSYLSMLEGNDDQHLCPYITSDKKLKLENLLYIGLRKIDEAELETIKDKSKGINVFGLKRNEFEEIDDLKKLKEKLSKNVEIFNKKKAKAIVNEIKEFTKEKKDDGTIIYHPFHISFDVDCLDPGPTKFDYNKDTRVDIMDNKKINRFTDDEPEDMVKFTNINKPDWKLKQQTTKWWQLNRFFNREKEKHVIPCTGTVVPGKKGLDFNKTKAVIEKLIELEGFKNIDISELNLDHCEDKNKHKSLDSFLTLFDSLFKKKYVSAVDPAEEPAGNGEEGFTTVIN